MYWCMELILTIFNNTVCTHRNFFMHAFVIHEIVIYIALYILLHQDQNLDSLFNFQILFYSEGDMVFTEIIISNNNAI